MSIVHTHLDLSIIKSNDPAIFLSKLESARHAAYLILRRPSNCTESHYLIERIHDHRQTLVVHKRYTGAEFSRDAFHHFEGVRWPGDLSAVPGPWRHPLHFSFPRLVVLDMGMQDAVLWLVPILKAIEPGAPFRRLLLRFCDDHDAQALPFPFEALDHCLSTIPTAKLLIGWAWGGIPEFAKTFRRNLPKLESEGRIMILHSLGPNCE